MEYFHFLIAFYVLASGCSILETAANPYILAMGPQESATERLNFAQSFNPVGCIVGLLLGLHILEGLNEADAAARAAMSQEQLAQIQRTELTRVSTIYALIGAIGLVIWCLIAFNKFPYAKDTVIKSSTWQLFGRLLKRKHWVTGVAAQFFYVGAQIGIWSYTIRYVMQNMGYTEERAWWYLFASMILFTVSRFVCTALMKVIAPHALLWTLALLAAALTAMSITLGGVVGAYSVVAISACMSLMFPTIYGLALHGLSDDEMKIGASGLIMAILGGAVCTAIQGKISDATGSINISYIVPMLCFLVVAFYGLVGYRADAPQPA